MTQMQAAVITQQHVIAIGRVDPEVMLVKVQDGRSVR